jgi:hypothetical protein
MDSGMLSQLPDKGVKMGRMPIAKYQLPSVRGLWNQIIQHEQRMASFQVKVL